MGDEGAAEYRRYNEKGHAIHFRLRSEHLQQDSRMGSLAAFYTIEHGSGVKLCSAFRERIWEEKAGTTGSDKKASATDPDKRAGVTDSDKKASATDSDKQAGVTDSDKKASATDSDKKVSATDSDKQAGATNPRKTNDAIMCKWYEVSSKPEGRDVVARIWISLEHDCAIIKDAFNENDVGQNRLRCSEIFFQILSLAEESLELLRNIRIVGVDTIINEGTKAAINIAEKESSALKNRNPGKEADSPDLGYREYTDADEGFFAILGSPLGMVIAHALDDHYQALGHKHVKKIIVLEHRALNHVGNNKISRNLIFILEI